jgi:IPT/TIG domain
MPDMTNITDTHVPTVGRTTTTLVASHTRGSTDFNTAVGQADNPAPPTITSLAPASISAAAGPTTITVHGTGFTASSAVHEGATPKATTFVSATQLTYSSDPAVAGNLTVTVHNGTAASAGSTLTVTA